MATMGHQCYSKNDDVNWRRHCRSMVLKATIATMGKIANLMSVNAMGIVCTIVDNGFRLVVC